MVVSQLRGQPPEHLPVDVQIRQLGIAAERQEERDVGDLEELLGAPVMDRAGATAAELRFLFRRLTSRGVAAAAGIGPALVNEPLAQTAGRPVLSCRSGEGAPAWRCGGGCSRVGRVVKER
jgi:hypothetical protein